MVTKNCTNCKKSHDVRQADVNRGWGKFCSKSCKAKTQERNNGQHAAYLHGRGVSNLHPKRLKLYDKHPEHGDWVHWQTGELIDPFDDDAVRQNDGSDLHDGHGQWED
jgi:hypothetical protein